MAPKASRKSGGDSKQGLIIALVFFVLISIVLGITTYTGYTADEGKDAKIKKAEDELKLMTKDRDGYKYQAMFFLNRIGQLKGDAQGELDQLETRYKQQTIVEKDRAEFEKAKEAVEKAQPMPWDAAPAPNAKAPPYETRLAEAKKKYEDLRDTIKGLTEQRDAAIARAKTS